MSRVRLSGSILGSLVLLLFSQKIYILKTPCFDFFTTSDLRSSGQLDRLPANESGVEGSSACGDVGRRGASKWTSDLAVRLPVRGILVRNDERGG